MVRKHISYRYSSDEKFEEMEKRVNEIITRDTGKVEWPVQKVFPPIGQPPAISENCLVELERLKALDIMVLGDAK